MIIHPPSTVTDWLIVAVFVALALAFFLGYSQSANATATPCQQQTGQDSIWPLLALGGFLALFA